MTIKTYPPDYTLQSLLWALPVSVDPAYNTGNITESDTGRVYRPAFTNIEALTYVGRDGISQRGFDEYPESSIVNVTHDMLPESKPKRFWMLEASGNSLALEELVLEHNGGSSLENNKAGEYADCLVKYENYTKSDPISNHVIKINSRRIANVMRQEKENEEIVDDIKAEIKAHVLNEKTSVEVIALTTREAIEHHKKLTNGLNDIHQHLIANDIPHSKESVMHAHLSEILSTRRGKHIVWEG